MSSCTFVTVGGDVKPANVDFIQATNPSANAKMPAPKASGKPRRLSGKIAPVDSPSVLAADDSSQQKKVVNESTPRAKPSVLARRNSLPTLLRRRSSFLTASASASREDDVPLQTEATKPPKSCMSVTNIEDSLRSANDDKPRRRASLPDLSTGHDDSSPWGGGAPGERRLNRRVSFHEVEVRNYKVTLGDNPCVRRGPPVSLSWHYDPNHDVLPLEEYETTRTPQRRGRRQLKLPKDVREERLKTEGVTACEMVKASMDVKAVKSQRNRTNQTLHRQQVQEVLENARRKLKRAVTLTSSKREQRKLWKDAQKWARDRRRHTKDGLDKKAVSSGHDGEDSKPIKPSTSTEGSSSYDSERGLQTPPPTPTREENEDGTPTVELNDDDWGLGLSEEVSPTSRPE